MKGLKALTNVSITSLDMTDYAKEINDRVFLPISVLFLCLWIARVQIPELTDDLFGYWEFIWLSKSIWG